MTFPVLVFILMSSIIGLVLYIYMYNSTKHKVLFSMSLALVIVVSGTVVGTLLDLNTPGIDRNIIRYMFVFIPYAVLVLFYRLIPSVKKKLNSWILGIKE